MRIGIVTSCFVLAAGCAPVPAASTSSPAPGALALRVDGRPIDCTEQPVLRAGARVQVLVEGPSPSSIGARVDGTSIRLSADGALAIEVPEGSLRTLVIESDAGSCSVRLRHDAALEAALAALAERSSDTPVVTWSSRSGAASMVLAELLAPSADAPDTAARLAPLFGASSETLVPVAARTSETGSMLVSAQQLGGLRVYGAALHLVLDASGERLVAQGALVSGDDPPAHVRSDDDARRVADAEPDARVERVYYDEVLLTGRGEPGARAGHLVHGAMADVLVDDERGIVIESTPTLHHVDTIEIHELADFDYQGLGNPSWSSMDLVLSGRLGGAPTAAPGVTPRDDQLRLFARADDVAGYYHRRGFAGWNLFSGSLLRTAPTPPHARGVTRWVPLRPDESPAADRGSFYWSTASIIAINVVDGTLDTACHEFAHSVDANVGGAITFRTLNEAVADLATIYCTPSIDPSDDPWALGNNACPQRSYRYPTRFGGPMLLDRTRCSPRRGAVYDFAQFSPSGSAHDQTFIVTHAFFRAVEGYGAPLRAYEDVVYDALALGRETSTLPAFRDWAIGVARTRAGDTAACALALGFRDTGLTGAGGPAALECNAERCGPCGPGTPRPRAHVGEDDGSAPPDSSGRDAGTGAPPATCSAGSAGSCTGDVLGRVICDGARGYLACGGAGDAGDGILAGECLCNRGTWVCLCAGGGMRAGCEPDPAECRVLDAEGAVAPPVSRRPSACAVSPGARSRGWLWLTSGALALAMLARRRRAA